MKTLIILAVLLYSSPPTSANFVGHDCTDTQSITSVPLASIKPPCTTINSRPANTIRAEIHELQGPKTVVGYRCYVHFNQSLVDWRGEKRPLQRETVFIGREACQQAHHSGVLELEHRVRNLIRNGTTNYSLRTVHPQVRIGKDLFVPGRFNTYYERDYVIELSQHSGLIDFDLNIVYFENGAMCDFDSFSCNTEHGEMAWSSNLQQQLSTSIFGGDITLFKTFANSIYPSETYAVIEFMFDYVSFKVFDDAFLNFGGRTVFRTVHPDLYVEPVKNTPSFSSHFQIIQYYVNLTKSYNSRNDPDRHRFGKIRYGDIAEKCCLKDGSNPGRDCDFSLASSCVLDVHRRGVIAVGSRFSSMVDVRACSKRIVHKRETGECFEEIPVYEKLQFLKLDSRILVDRAEPIDCRGTRRLRPPKEDCILPAKCDTPKGRKTGFITNWLGPIIFVGVVICVWLTYGIVRMIVIVMDAIKDRQSSVSQGDKSAQTTSFKRSLFERSACFSRKKERELCEFELS